MALPYGWNERYALEHALEQINQLTAAISAQHQRIAYLESEVTRLDATKASKKGRPPKKATAQA